MTSTTFVPFNIFSQQRQTDEELSGPDGHREREKAVIDESESYPTLMCKWILTEQVRGTARGTLAAEER